VLQLARHLRHGVASAVDAETVSAGEFNVGHGARERECGREGRGRTSVLWSAVIVRTVS
jgi:hypothetical protein